LLSIFLSNFNEIFYFFVLWKIVGIVRGGNWLEGNPILQENSWNCRPKKAQWAKQTPQLNFKLG
jgi:hypothetical protein